MCIYWLLVILILISRRMGLTFLNVIQGFLPSFSFFFIWYRFGFIFLNLVCWFVETICLYFWFGLFSIEWLEFQYTFFLFLTICLWSYILITFAIFSESFKKLIYIKLGWEEKCLVPNSTFFWLFMFYLHSKNKTINAWQKVDLTQVQTSDASHGINW